MTAVSDTVGEFIVAFLLVFTVSRTAVNSDFVYSLMASSCRLNSLRKGRKCTLDFAQGLRLLAIYSCLPEVFNGYEIVECASLPV